MDIGVLKERRGASVARANVCCCCCCDAWPFPVTGSVVSLPQWADDDSSEDEEGREADLLVVFNCSKDIT